MKHIFFVLLLSFAVGKAWAFPVPALVDTASVQCSAEVITRGDTVYSTLEALDVACLQINTQAGFVIEGGASYEAQIVDGSPNARIAAGSSATSLSILSPTAAGLGKFADIPVNYNNGLPQITIPVTVVKEGELQLPVTLQYHASGVKVEEVAGWVGLNWTLSAGGVINRQVMGGPDESYGGGSKGQVPQTSYYNTRTGYYADRGFRPFVPFLVCSPPASATPLAQNLRLGDEFLGSALGIKDTEPDLFTFNVAGYTGKFYFDTLRQVHLIPQQDVKILVNFDNAGKQFSTWTLVTPDGTRYHFGENNAYETSRTGAGSNAYPLSVAELRSSWLLTRVESADRQRNIYLEYTAEETAYRNLAPEKLMLEGGVYTGPTTADQRISTTRVYGRRLTKIAGSSTEVNFTANDLREDVDISSTAKRLHEIQVKAVNEASCLRYRFTYDYWTSSLPSSGDGDAVINTGSDNDDLKRLRLLSVQEFSCDNAQSKPAYVFSYAAGALPRRLSYQRDHWGYFNGRFNNNSLIPDDIAPGTLTTSIRTADATLQKRGHLYQITYPTGGFMRFTMEAHTDKGGLRVQRIAEYFSPTDSVVRTFDYISPPLEPFQRFYSKTLNTISSWGDFVQSGCPLTGGLFKSFSGTCYSGKLLIGSHLFAEAAGLTGQAIAYSNVRVNYANSGSTTYRYLISQYTSLYGQSNEFPFVADNALYYIANGTLEAEEHYNQAGQIQQKTVYTYSNPDPVTLATAPALRFATETCPPCPSGSACDLTTTVAFQRYNRQTVRQLLLKKTEYHYNLDGSGAMTNATVYTYGNQHEQAVRTAMQNSRGDSLISETRFVRDLITSETGSFTGAAYPLLLMRRRNMNAPVEQLIFIKKTGQDESQKKAIEGSYTLFAVIGSDTNLLKPTVQYSLKVPDALSITPVSVSAGTLTYAVSQYEPRINFTYYTSSGSKGLLETERAEKGAPTRYSYNAKRLLESRTEGFGTGQSQTTYYTHDALFGPTQIQNPRGLNTNFLYDGLGRLQQVKDHATHLVKEYEYHYFSSSSNPINSVTEFTPRTAGSSLPGGSTNLQTTIGYVDGLGRALQSVGKAAGPNGSNDIVAGAQTYDATGRLKRTYVPFPNTGSGSLAALPGSVHGDSAPYSENSLFDDSPLKRVTKTYGPGQAWLTADKAVTVSYGTAGSEVPNITVTATGTAGTGNYENYTLFKKIITNERNLATFEFSNKDGQLVERWTPDTTGGQYLKTAYVYDDLGRLRYVIQPQGRHTATAFNETDAVFTQYVFAYQYDRRGRVIRKHTPGGGWTNMVYDALDRVVLQQDAQQAAEATPKWTFIKYDALGRTIQTGETATATTFTTLQQQVDADNDQFEVRNNVSTGYYYTQLTTPAVTAAEVHSINYYDDYNDWRAGDLVFLSSFQSPYTTATGLLTGTAHRLLDGSNQWFYKAHYYNYRDQIIQTRQRDYPSLAHYVQTDVDYNFVLQVTQQKRLYQKQGTSDVLVKESFDYDHVGRKTRYQLGLNSSALDTVAQYQYDAVGRLTGKTIRPTRTYQRLGTGAATITRNAPPPANTNDIASQWIVLNPGFNTVAAGTYTAQIGTGSGTGTVQGLQTINYAYNIRDWLLSLNGGTLNGAENDLFAMKLDFEADGTYYDGNIRKQTWINSRDQQSRNYTYTYDLANRLKQAAYAGNGSENYALPLMQYDKNGNMTALQRNGKDGSGFGAIDRLSYTYAGNRLLYVNDAVTGNENTGDFRNDNTGTDDYSYWADGSLKTDKNKGISQIDYNFLNLPQQVQLSGNKQVAFVYDGNGRKIEKKTTINGNPQTASYYLDGAIYEKQGAGTYGLYQIGHEEGRIVPINDTLRLEFSYTDQLGSLRLSFRDSLASPQSGIYKAPVITQISQTDPWGLPLRGMEFENTTASSKFKFLNRESQAETGWIDLMARQYDAQLGVFRSVDPVIEGQEHLSLYQYGWNNPILMSDPNGTCPFCPIIPYLPVIGAAIGEGLVILAEATVTSGAIIGLTELIKSSGSGAGGAYSPGVSFAMSTSRPGELTTVLHSSSSKTKGNNSASTSQSSSSASATPENPDKKNKNKNDAEGNFVLYEVKAKDGTPLKVGKADADRTNAQGFPVRMKDSERKAKKEYPGATAEIIPGSQRRTTTGEMKQYEAETVRNKRASGNKMPLNKEKDKRYNNQ
ncbi:RHS repeat domain-containing protein [Runella slithyformis]|uniref:RHS repeat-associated core domain protein n=1 Tax=Runella slithyformis (strain ATCC 29530 / DSM 19594 / LMG 11500 / NCIMB 11436 / LSU 4) TaxID=761193 RepID=A0A7U3ZRR6_RUNSL|nr:DUF6443 domain-containing protein [Runella slithyformis]AEI52172.1 RHS repeat-associated core domain protein [Runella slithyformis DSM 19594]